MKLRLMVVLCIGLLSSCSTFMEAGSSDDNMVQQQEPTIQFIEKKELVVAKSSIESVDAETVINSYLRLMQSPHQEVKRQAMRRLADLNMRLTEEKLIALADGKTEDQIPPAIFQASYQKAADLYQQVLDDFPAQSDDATIRYQLARALALQGNSEESLLQLDNLVEKHSSSAEWVEVQFRRGEAYFLRKEYRLASEAYQQVVDFGEQSDFYEKALYKNGWSQFKRLDYELALRQFFPLYERLTENQVTDQEVQNVLVDIIKDTQRAISLSFYSLEGDKSVTEYFAQTGRKDYEHDIYGNLAQLYLTQQRYQDAASSYQAFIKNNPLNDYAIRFQLATIDTFVEGGFPSLVLPSKEKLLKQFGVKSDYWFQASQLLKDEVTPQIIRNLDEVSSHYHAAAQKSKKANDYKIAAEWYSHFLVLFEDEAKRAPKHMLMAEALLDGKDFEQASKEFEFIAYQYTLYPNRETAGFNAIVAADNWLIQLKPENLEKRTELQDKIMSDSIRFSSSFPSSKQAANLLIRTVEQQLTLKRIEQAIETSNKLIALEGPKTKIQLDRAKIVIANGLFDLKQYAEAEKAITRVLNEATLTPSESKQFHQYRAQSIYQLAEKLKEEKKYAEAIAEFQRVYLVEPNDEIRPNAEMEAAVLMLKTEQWQSAKLALEGFRGRYVSHPLAKGIDERLVFVYEKLSLWGDAAVALTRIADIEPDVAKKREYIWYVAELHEKSNNRTEAIASYKRYVWDYPEPFINAMEGRAKLVDLYTLENDNEKRLFWQNQIVKFYNSAGDKNTDRTRYLTAKASFELAEPLYQQFRSISLSLPLNKSLTKKRRAMDDALAAYTKIANFKVAEFTTASTHRVGELYAVLAKDIMSSQRPKGMSEDELEEYNYLIEDQAFPIEEKAIAIYLSNFNRVTQNIYDNWIKKSHSELIRLQPARFNKQETTEQWYGVSR